MILLIRSRELTEWCTTSVRNHPLRSSGNNDELQIIKSTNTNINSIISNTTISIQDLSKKQSEISKQTNPIDINLQSIVDNTTTTISEINAKHDMLSERINNIDMRLDQPKQLDPNITAMISNSLTSVKDLTRKHNDMHNMLNSLRSNQTTNNSPSDSSLIIAYETRIKRIEELLNLA